MALPIDVILSKILPKLPSRSLRRFKCVCKSFRTTISSLVFIINYLQPCHSSNVNRFLILPGRYNKLHSYNLDSQESAIITDLDIPSAFNRLDGYASIIGSCNGLICISKTQVFTRHFILLNPRSGRFWEIPFKRYHMSRRVSFGFGYDAATGEYKIVSFSNTVDKKGPRTWVDAVYSLKADYWRRVGRVKRAPGYIHVPLSDKLVLLGNDLLHCVCTLSGRSWWIGCFDIGSETWRDDVMMPMHYNDHGDGVFVHDIGVLDEGLCSTFENRRAFNFEVWIMKEHGVTESWVWLFSISTLRVPGRICPIVFRKHQLLLATNYPTKLLWYNSSSDEIVEVEPLNKIRDLSSLRAWIVRLDTA